MRCIPCVFITSFLLTAGHSDLVAAADDAVRGQRS